MVELQIQNEDATKAEELAREHYVDTQFQRSEPIGVQPPIPAGVHDIELSWDRRQGYMRIIIGGKTWWFKEYLGKAQLIKTDNERGRLHLRAMALIDGETLIMYRDPDAATHPVAEGMKLETTHNRLCYWRERRLWRLRDERKTQANPGNVDALKYVRSYVGDLSAEWNREDPVAHIYHNGYTVVDADNVAHLYDPELQYGK